MADHDASGAMERLGPLIGEWHMEAVFPPTSPAAGMEVGGVARTRFEWLAEGALVLQRWEVPHPAAPDGIAVIGWDPGRDSLVQHYFDSRGVVRLYAMHLDERVWTLLRTEPDFSPLDFGQRFTATISDDGRTINGRWEIANEPAQWEHDFDLVYRKITKRPEREPADGNEMAGTARQIIETNSYMVLGTADANGTPWASPVWFAHSGYGEFFWVSRPDVQHSLNIAERPEIGIVIFDSTASNADAQGVYLEARAEPVLAAELPRAVEIVSRRSEARGGEALTLMEVTAPSELRVYRATATAHFVLGATDRRIPVPGV